MKKLFAFIIAIFIISLYPNLKAKAFLVQSPIDSYGFADSISNLWTDDTLDAQDNDLAGDVDWFAPIPGFPLNNPSSVYIGGIQRFSGITFSLGNSPLLVGQKAKFNFYYGTIQNINNVATVVYKPLTVKDIDGGMSTSNRSYKYTFAIPQDWMKLHPHVRARGDDMYYIKMVCDANCSNGINNGNFQINQIVVERTIRIQTQQVGNYCATHPFDLQCLAGQI